MREFCELAFEAAGMPIVWHGEGIQEVAIDSKDRTLVRIDPRYFRPAEVDLLLGDARYAREKLGWRPEVSFGELVRLMVEADIRFVEV